MPIIDDFEDLRKEIARIRLDELPRCPIAPSKLLHDCLKEPARCPEQCRHREAWTGPDKKENTYHDDYCD